MSILDGLNIGLGVCALILTVLATVQAVYFYTQSKNAEKNVNDSLVSIRTQTDALQKLTEKWMDRLTKYATEDNPVNKHMEKILTSILPSPGDLTNNISQITQSSTGISGNSELVLCYIAIFYYSCSTNIFVQNSLPFPSDFDQNNEFHMFVKKIVDESYADVKYLSHVLVGIEREKLQENVLFHLYEQAKFYEDNVGLGDSAMIFANRSKQ